MGRSALAAAVALSALLVHLAVPPSATAQTPHSSEACLAGTVRDAATHEPLAGVRVALPLVHRGAVTDRNGTYRITSLPEGSFTIEVRLLGYETIRRTVALVPDSTLRVDLELRTVSLRSEEVTVESARERERDRTTTSRVELTQQTIEQLPSVGGESDLFRALQLMPGVKALSEASSGLYIRGGPPDQNLVMLDHNVIYNPTHLFGFFSTFNTDAMRDVTLIKGGSPPEYGGRLSGVLDVTTRDGADDGLHGKTSLGLISAGQVLEGPVPGGDLIVAARRTYIDGFLSATNADTWLGGGLALPRYYFYDLNVKLDEHPGPSDRVSLSAYRGSDHLHYPNDSWGDITLEWGNTLASAEWTHLFSDHLVARTFLGSSSYASSTNGTITTSPFEFTNGIAERAVREDVDLQVNADHALRFGAGLSRFTFDLYNVLGSSNQPLKDTVGVPWYLSGYAQDEWHLTDRLTATYGLRIEWLDLANAATLDPRVTLAYQLTPDWTLKGFAGRYHQFLHLVSAGEFTFFDLWVPGTAPLPPSRSDQFILSLSGYPNAGLYVSSELYYKKLTDIVEYNETKFLSDSIDQIFPRGTGAAYGVELFVRGTWGPLSGWLGYTLSKVTEQIPVLNNGAAFSPKYDQRHDIQLVANYQLSESWRLGLTWTYATGQAYTSTLGYYHLGLDEVGYEQSFPIPGTLGALRLPDYHRADLSLKHTFHLFGERAQASLDLFNVYSHRNVWFRIVNTDAHPATVSDVLLLPIIPTLSMEVSY